MEDLDGRNLTASTLKPEELEKLMLLEQELNRERDEKVYLLAYSPEKGSELKGMH